MISGIVMCQDIHNDTIRRKYDDRQDCLYQTDKRSGITYTYRSVASWDKAKHQSHAKCMLIGRVHPEMGASHRSDRWAGSWIKRVWCRS